MVQIPWAGEFGISQPAQQPRGRCSSPTWAPVPITPLPSVIISLLSQPRRRCTERLPAWLCQGRAGLGNRKQAGASLTLFIPVFYSNPLYPCRWRRRDPPYSRCQGPVGWSVTSPGEPPAPIIPLRPRRLHRQDHAVADGAGLAAAKRGVGCLAIMFLRSVVPARMMVVRQGILPAHGTC